MTSRRECIQTLAKTTAAITLAAAYTGVSANAAESEFSEQFDTDKDAHPVTVIITISLPDHGFLSPKNISGRLIEELEGGNTDGLTHMPPGDVAPPHGVLKDHKQPGPRIRNINLDAYDETLSCDRAWLVLKKCGAINALLADVQSHYVRVLTGHDNKQDTPIEND